jgi:predicted translin family RNA/ssDNA-binding protein
LEEYVEGILFYTWMYGDGGNGRRGTNQPAGKILLPDELSPKISTEDYLGGLCDLTGEIGRFAVARGTVRDKQNVKLCLESNKSIYMTLKMLGRLPKNLGKKLGAVSSSVDKLERLLYEQSLMEMTGRKEFSSSVEDHHASGFENEAEEK